MRTTDRLTAARVEALFVSGMGTGARASRRQADAAIRAALRANGGVRGCLAAMATAYGEHPDIAVRRSAWARRTVDRLYPTSCSRS